MQGALQISLKKPLIIENRAAAGGTVAANEVAKSVPDGHTWLLGFNGPIAFAPYLYKKLPYAPQTDLQPVILTTAQPNLIAVNKQFAARNLAEVIAVLKNSPDKHSYASVGNGSSSHLTMEYFKLLTDTSILHVPFNGGGLPVMQAMVSGDTQIIGTVPSTLMPQISAGGLRAIAVTGSKRYALLPDVPTVRESGIAALANFESLAWNGVLVRAGTPRQLVDRINTAVNLALKDAAVQARLRAAGLDPLGGTPEAFAALISSESTKWAPVIQATGASID
jgi:tripartite-type tricarboxylate transporter receptor subunit TctC